VDDGSDDDTANVVEMFPAQIPIRCVRMAKNGGKGAALAKGIQFITEQQQQLQYASSTSPSSSSSSSSSMEDILILTQDADGSGDLLYLDEMAQTLRKLLPSIDPDPDHTASSSSSSTSMTTRPDWSVPGMVVGNRNYDFFSARGVTRWGFQTTVRLIMNDLRVQDSQCGYKLMTLPAAQCLYKDLHLRGWSHDVEVLYRAKLLNFPIQEVKIDWEDKDGSKVVASGVVKVSLQMLWDVIRLRWNYSISKAWSC
jgi:dolichyl-phosphate beta-glucosyltransferase